MLRGPLEKYIKLEDFKKLLGLGSSLSLCLHKLVIMRLYDIVLVFADLF